MPLLSLQQAADRIGVSRTTIEDWSRRGLLEIHVQPPGDSPDARMVDEEELDRITEQIGWLQLSADSWDGPAEE
jgi:predicted site-specific integrase-resolvase